MNQNELLRDVEIVSAYTDIAAGLPTSETENIINLTAERCGCSCSRVIEACRRVNQDSGHIFWRQQAQREIETMKRVQK